MTRVVKCSLYHRYPIFAHKAGEVGSMIDPNSIMHGTKILTSTLESALSSLLATAHPASCRPTVGLWIWFGGRGSMKDFVPAT